MILKMLFECYKKPSLEKQKAYITYVKYATTYFKLCEVGISVYNQQSFTFVIKSNDNYLKITKKYIYLYVNNKLIRKSINNLI